MSFPFRDQPGDPSPPRGGFGSAGGGWDDGPGGSGRSGGFWRSVFRSGDNPLTWALPLGRSFGIEVRLSLLFAIFIVIQIVAALMRGTAPSQAMMIGSLFALVLLHEFGHCFACRWVRGTADEILMWPLGGLASCRPPHHWRADLITTIGGPIVNVILVPVLAGAILLTGGSGEALLFNPFNYTAAWLGYADTWWKSWIWHTYFVNWLLLAFNVLVPAFPMDGGRIMQALLWRNLGHRRSMEIATTVGLFAACVLGILGVTAGDFNLFGIAMFCGIVCYQEKQRLRFAAAMGAHEEPEDALYASSLRLVRDDEPEPETRAQVAARKKAEQAAQQEREEAAELDRILEKIARTGRDSLTGSEQRFLRTATNKRRLQ
jgi:Zn-dependent protease